MVTWVKPCAWPEPWPKTLDAAPLHNDVAFGPEGGAAHWLTCDDGVRIRIGVWQPQSPVGTVLIFPGRTEYVEKYGETAKAFVEAGYAAISIDWRGQGLADRLTEVPALGHVGVFSDYQRDVAAVLSAVETLSLPGPLFLVAHSMGGCIGLRALYEGLDAQAAVFTGPMWGIGLSVALRPVAWTLSSIARPLGFGKSFPLGVNGESYVATTDFAGNTLTTDRDQFDRLRLQLEREPGFALGGPSYHWLNEALRETRKLSQMPSPSVPALTFLGTNERIVDVARVRSRMANWPNGRLVLLQGGEHEILMERDDLRLRALSESLDFFGNPSAAVSLSA